MKTVGTTLMVLGALIAIGILNTALRRYNFQSSRDLSKLFGALAIGGLMFLAGLGMVWDGKGKR